MSGRRSSASDQYGSPAGELHTDAFARPANQVDRAPGKLTKVQDYADRVGRLRTAAEVTAQGVDQGIGLSAQAAQTPQLQRDIEALHTNDPECRDAARRRVLKAGVVCFNNRHSTLPCTVRDLSPEGAKLQLSGSINAPDTFELYIELDGSWAECHVVWRCDDLIGVRFAAPIAVANPIRKQVINPVGPTEKPSLRRRK